jgi:N-acetylmuramoyl-L-alanine amidase
MSRPNGKNKWSRWVWTILLALALIVNGSTLGVAHAAEYKAAIGAVNYQTLDAAFGAVSEGQTIRLLCPVAIGPGLETGIINRPGVHFYLDLGKQTISGNQADALIKVTAGTITVFNGQIINSNANGLAVSSAAEPIAKISFPIGYQTPATLGPQLNLPAAYHLTCTNGANGTIRYGSTSGPKVPTAYGNLYAGGTGTHSFYFVPSIGYKVGTFSVNSVNQPVASKYTVANLTQNKAINVTFQKITFTITPKAYANNVVAKRGVILNSTSAVVEYGGSKTFTYTVREGFQLLDVQVNNVSIGPVTTIQLTNVTTPQTIKILLKKTALFIMLDAGHYINYNHSPVLASYYEGNVMWTYHKYLKLALEQYPNIIVDTTRPDNSAAIGSALGPWERGAMGEGYDLVLSVHSNAASTSSADHPVAICTLDPRFSAVSKALGMKLANKVAAVMNTNQAAVAYVKAQSDGQDWYGVNRGATSVGVPSIILEHSFHTNYRSAVWLSQDANLRTLATAEADVIAGYYGITKTVVLPAPKTPLAFDAYGIAYDKSKILWSIAEGATGYEVYRATTKDGAYSLIKTTSEHLLIDAGLTCGSVYYYKVRAYTTTSEGPKYSAYTLVNPARPTPAKPTLHATGMIQKAYLSWNIIDGAQGYEVYRTSGTSGTWTKVKTISSGSTHTWSNTGLSTGKIYSYEVRAYRVVESKQVFGKYSLPISAKIK